MTDHIEPSDDGTQDPDQNLGQGAAETEGPADPPTTRPDYRAASRSPITPGMDAATRGLLRQFIASPAYDDVLRTIRRHAMPETPKLLPDVVVPKVFPDVVVPKLLPPMPKMLPDVVLPQVDVQKLFNDVSPQVHAVGAMKINSLLPKIGLPHQAQVAAVARSVSEMVSGHLVIPDLSAGLLGGGVLAGLQESIGSLFRDWHTLAWAGHRLARLALWAARGARNAVLHGDTEAVKAFARDWLEFARLPATMLEAVIAALLEPGWDTTPMDDDTLIKHLRARSKANHNLWRPSDETQIGGRLVQPFDARVTADGPSLLDITPAPDTKLAETYTDPWLRDVLSHFTDIEIAIIEVHADGGCTWASAATLCGQPTELGESIRRRLNRRKAQVEARRGPRTAAS
ncbi:hypothetical protein A5788_10560 [Gordonia sp. 852002-50816_SCH5313054-c]|nr:hypothetical protein A5785_07095 [Gordonia sp. 852002-50395_SCH5434458]OBC17846.1 hypothetical protein A5786_17795 [Gordonia sp. 852002-50816_SCH5313054-a]OBC18244.1 hypothetical protein A5788_10560 [Gordonia sp. 852002-50816_SCH5313054-c]SKX69626.1 Uncharacterised protein [Mycobacteroides abscessus subsp. abscessus]